MSQKFLLLSLLAVCTVAAFAFYQRSQQNPTVAVTNKDKGIQFIESNWQKALDLAKKEHKLIFLDAYATWCGPCKMLKKNTFPDEKAGAFFNQHFINVAIDMESGDGPMLAAKFQVDAYPTLIIANAKGEMITFTKGFIGPAELIKFGQYGLEKKK